MKTLKSSISSSFKFSEANSFKEIKDDDEVELKLAAIERLPTIERLRSNIRSSFKFSEATSFKQKNDNEFELKWAAIERLPTFQQLRTSIIDGIEVEGKKSVIDVAKLGALERHVFIEKLLENIEEDNRRLLQKLKERIVR